MKGNPSELHGDGIMTEKHGAETDWMTEHGESLDSINEGDMVHVIDEGHASTDTDTEYKVTTVPTMEYDFDVPVIDIVEVGTYGPAITIKPGKVSTTAQR